jgi:hypothetical protein
VTPLEIEAWVLRLVETVRAGNKVEDTRAELKGDWLEPAKAARQIAGLANAARGESVLWVIGLDEERGVLPRSAHDLADWWAQVRRRFDEDLAPEMKDVCVPTGDNTNVMALLFETDRAPYVVKNSEGGQVEREVPWRDGTATHSARRSNLVQILAPVVHAPRIELVGADLYLERPHSQPGLPSGRPWRLVACVYVTAMPNDYLVMREADALVTIETSDGDPWSIESLRLFDAMPVPFNSIPDRARLFTVQRGVDQLIITGPGYAWVSARGYHATGVADASPKLNLSLQCVDPPTPVTVSATLAYQPPDGQDGTTTKWVLPAEGRTGL